MSAHKYIRPSDLHRSNTSLNSSALLRHGLSRGALARGSVSPTKLILVARYRADVSVMFGETRD